MSESLENQKVSQQIGQLFFVGIPGPEIDPDTEELLTLVRPGGVCLFARNIREAGQTRKLTDDLRRLLGNDVIISLDQEGGRVDRLRRILEPMPQAELIVDEGLAEMHGVLTAKALRILGFNMNFAPVVDVETSSRDCSSNGLATRSFGASPEAVFSITSSYLRALESGGIQGCLKHFPGLGASVVDSHEQLPEVQVTPGEFREIDLAPYASHFRAGFTGAVMVGHAVYPGLEAQTNDEKGLPLPSSLSNSFIAGLLRNEMGFSGLVLTDDLEMGAILHQYGIGDASTRALLAGNDQVLICNDPKNILAAHEAVSKSVRDGVVGAKTVANALARIYDFKGRLCPPLEFDADQLSDLSDRIRQFKASLTA